MEKVIQLNDVKSEDDISLAVNGDKGAFVRIINENKGLMYKMGRTILRDDNDISDAMQQAIYNAYKSINKLKDKKNLKPWLLRIMINECNNILRERQRVIVVENVVENSFIEDYKVDKDYIFHAIGGLEDELKILVLLYYYEDMKISKISEKLSLPEGTVKSRLSRARKKLYELLKEDVEYGR
ncbi:RNA polymerase sigma factor [Clostridium hydrogeniformans]|uniref:RNA polymerase sigma factor n=1 Tax=Clostridium hydrogeniformans TaxID=349933 RepID=UPI000485670C|nr:RNA polymerase sigma factor [Clostridium hydrogeniformans]